MKFEVHRVGFKATHAGSGESRIPEFNDRGYLPPGIHLATLDEIAVRFGQEPDIRRAELESRRWLVELATRVGVTRIIVDGSFVADVWEPIDVDCVLLAGPAFPKDSNQAAAAELGDGLPFIHLLVADQILFEDFANRIFATDRRLISKGLVEVVL
jgi:hypothetical protein